MEYKRSPEQFHFIVFEHTTPISSFRSPKLIYQNILIDSSTCSMNARQNCTQTTPRWYIQMVCTGHTLLQHAANRNAPFEMRCMAIFICLSVVALCKCRLQLSRHSFVAYSTGHARKPKTVYTQLHPSVFLVCEQWSTQKVAGKSTETQQFVCCKCKCKCVSACAKEIAQETDVLIQNDNNNDVHDDEKEVSDSKIKWDRIVHLLYTKNNKLHLKLARQTHSVLCSAHTQIKYMQLICRLFMS